MFPKYSGAQRYATEPLFPHAPSRTQAFILVTDADGLTRWVNRAFERVMGYTFEEVEGQKPGHILDGRGTGHATSEAIAFALEAGQAVQIRVLTYRKNGTAVWVDLEIRPLLDEAAHAIGFVHSGRPVEGSTGLPSAGRPLRSTGPYRILVAEDHPINLKLVLALLQAAGCEAHCVENGRQALAELDNADFDLVILDSLMPVMTGIEAIAVIRSRPDWKRFVPILSLTAHAMKGAEEYHTSAGADLYMSKPLRSDRFIGAVNRLARHGRELCGRNGACADRFSVPVKVKHN
jgi:PAS domain S-box-containing protein